MKDLQGGLGVENISDLVLKELYSIYKIKNPAKEQIKKYKMAEREIFEKYNLNGNEQKTKNKEVYAKNYVMTTVIKCCRGEKRGKRKIDGFRKKLMISGSEIAECPEHEVKSKIGNIFLKKKILEEYSEYFMSITKKKYKLTKMRMNTYYLELMLIFLNIS